MTSRWARTGVVGVALVGTAAAIASFAAPGGAQVADPIAIEFTGADHAATVSDDGSIVVFESNSLDVLGDIASTRIVLHDRLDSESPTTTVVTGSESGLRPGISGDGCVLAWSTRVSPTSATIVTVDRCETPRHPSRSRLSRSSTMHPASDRRRCRSTVRPSR